MPQHRPPGGRRRRDTMQARTGSDVVEVAAGAVESMRRSIGRGRGKLTDLASGASGAERTFVESIRAELGDKLIARVTRTVSGRAPTVSTIRRWARTNRVPSPAVASALERYRFVATQGGIDAVAQAIGRSPSAVRKWMNGRQGAFRGDAQEILERLLAAEREARLDEELRRRMIAAGVMHPDGRIKTPTVYVVATVEIRVPGGNGYTYTTQRTINLDPDSLDKPESGLDEAEARELAVAVALDRPEDVLSIIERKASLEYAEFDTYDNSTGIHIIDVDQITITWI